MHIQAFLLLPLILLLASGCSSFSASNVKKQPGDQQVPTKATFNVSPDRGRDDTLVILALSGGGSRAAYLSTSVMFRLSQVFDDLDLLAQVDAISSVSGGSLPAAYYAISTEPGEGAATGYGREWEEQNVKRRMERNYIGRWVGNWFWPYNIGKYWFTDYDRTDIMAQTFADNLYDTRPAGRDLKIGDLLPERPYLILNATNGTENQFGTPFAFTRETFEELDSDINAYDLSRAVMASASFPAVFNYMTLRNHSDGVDDDERFTHVFDGGNFDNLGLESVLRILKTLKEEETEYDRLVVILVDAYAESGGVSGRNSDSRKFFDFIIDSNFIDATDSLLKSNRERVLKTFEANLSRYRPASKSIFYHIQFADVADPELKRELNRIKTDFRIDPEDAKRIDRAVRKLLTPENTCMVAIRELIVNGNSSAEWRCAFSG